MIQERVTIIGTGALGGLLAKAFSKKGIEIYSLFNRSSASLKKLAPIIEPVYCERFPTNVNQLGDVVFITVPDQYISKIAQKLSVLSNNFSDKIIVHCSGTKPAAVLDSLKEKEANTAAFHPIQTFSVQSKPEDFKNIYFDIEGDDKAKAFLKRSAEELKAYYFEVSPQAKPYLHAAGVMTSNYLFVLLSLASSIGEMGGIDRKKVTRAMLPLAAKTIENVQSAEQLGDALSGPIARGDYETVEKHLTLLREDPKTYNLYQSLGEETLKLAEQKGTLSDEQKNKLKKSFDNQDMK